MTIVASKIELRQIGSLKPYPGNARRHSKRQVKQIARSIQRWGFTNPVLVSDENEIMAGHGRVMAAKEIGLQEIPTLRLSHLSPTERRAYVIADNKLALNAGWDTDILAIELQSLIDLNFDVELTGFSPVEIDLTLDQAREKTTETIAPADVVPEPAENPVSRPEDIWVLGQHRLICGDARNASHYQALLSDERADLVFTDPPYNVAIDNNVCGKGFIRHREFAMASGEMSPVEFTAFLSQTLCLTASRCRDGAIAFVCMDWRHMREMQDAGASAFVELKNVCVWNKTNGGMGTFYRSKHEFIFVFKIGAAPHTNNFGLGDTGRYRTNVWDYAGVSSMSAHRQADLAMHPTVKPTALVADAIRDCTKRNEIVLDCFGGSGTTLIAAETCGRKARLVEYDAVYCDTIVSRWERFTGKQATLARTGRTFEDEAECRSLERLAANSGAHRHG